MIEVQFTWVKCPYCGFERRVDYVDGEGQMTKCEPYGSTPKGCGKTYGVRITKHTVVTLEKEIFKMEKVNQTEEAK